jgi:hypothetical protein
MVAADRDRWQAGRVRSLTRVSALVALILAVALPTALATGPAHPRIVQAPAGSPEGPRVMSFAWTLYPRMWAELDLRLAVGAEAVAEVTAKGAT